MENAVFFAIAVGLIGGAFFGYLSGKQLALRLSKQSHSPRIVLACASAGAFLILLPAFFASFVVGGNLGGSLGKIAGYATGLGFVGVPVGLALGIALILTCGLAVGALFGGLLGKAFAYVFHKST